MVDNSLYTMNNVIENNISFKKCLYNLVKLYSKDERFDGIYLYQSSDNSFEIILIYNRIDDEILKLISSRIHYSKCIAESGVDLHLNFQALDEENLRYSGLISSSKVLLDKTGKLTKLKTKIIKKENKKVKIKKRWEK